MVRIASDSWGWARPAIFLFIVTYFSLALAACGGAGGFRPGPSASTAAADGAPPSDTAPAPQLTLAVVPERVPPGGSAEVNWSSSNADTCEASAGWHGDMGASGSVMIGPVEKTTNLRLSCSGPGGGISRNVTLEVVDGPWSVGSPIEDLAGS